MKRTLTQAIMILALFTTISLQAQVTIGSDQAPNKGALLDLTEGSNTTKGLGMPRVELTNLKPTTPAELSASIGGTGNWALNDHTALAVYNTKADRCAIPEAIYEGLYVFDGTEWQYLGKKPEPSPDVSYYEDNRTQVHGTQHYPYRSFGIAAGVWMLENMRYRPDDNDATMQPSQIGDSTDPNKYIFRRYMYPQPTGTETDYTQIPTWDVSQGILYSYAAATNGERDTESSDKGNNPTEHTITPTVGICPIGWHIPTDYEWSVLEEELAKHPQQYSSVTTATPWRDRQPGSRPGYNVPSDDDYEAFNERPSSGYGHGTAMKSECPAIGSSIESNGKSHSTTEGGFEALLVGLANEATTVSYGYSACFWTASVDGPYSAWNRRTYRHLNSVGRSYSSRYLLLSVRCKKD